MKIVLSRKGFDAGYGGIPSPVLPSGQIISLPIPSSAGSPAQLCRAANSSLGEIVSDLTRGRLDGRTLVHLDPDLDEASAARRPGWRPAFGQLGAAQAHLANQGICAGDLYLYFGWFRPVERCVARWQYVANAPSFHGLFGWLQIDTIIDVDVVGAQNTPAWLADHPHIAHAGRFAGQRNTIYVATPDLKWGTAGKSVCGGGMFTRWSSALKLTAPGQSRSVWSVPTWLEPRDARPALTYHGRADRWVKHDNELYLRTVAKGQEFVLDADCYPEAIEWAQRLIEDHA